MAFECVEQRGFPQSESGTVGEAGVVTEDDQVSFDTPDSSARTPKLKIGCSLRGARASNAAVKEFWIACRGAEFAYAS